MRKNHYFLLIFLILFLIIPIFSNISKVYANPAEPVIRVLLEEDLDVVTISSEEMEILGMIVPIVARGEQIFYFDELSGPISINPVKGFLQLNGQPYRGELLIKPGESGLMVINSLPLEEYLYSVLPSEIDPDWPMEALKAQAVAARCYAVSKITLGKEEFDVYDDVRSQVYYGMRKEHPRTTSAVETTRGLVATYNGEVIQAYFFASGGGKTANSEDVWGRTLPYLKSVDDFDHNSPHFFWKTSFTPEDIMESLVKEGIEIGELLDIIPVAIDSSNRVVKLKLIGDKGEEYMSGTRFRLMLNLKSTKFTIKNHYPRPINPQSVEKLVNAVIQQNKQNPEDFIGQDPMEIQITGYGWGHGVGMSQWGTKELAHKGADFIKILTHYYQGIEIETLY